jgi:Translocase of the Inner Mitochondrial membrane 29
VVRRSFLGRIRDAQTAKLVNVGTRIKDKFTYKLPEKYKGTWVDRLVTYWQSLVRDYKDAGLDTLRDMRDNPLKAAAYGGLLGTSYYFATNCPDDVKPHCFQKIETIINNNFSSCR